LSLFAALGLFVAREARGERDRGSFATPAWRLGGYQSAMRVNVTAGRSSHRTNPITGGCASSAS